LLAGLALIKVDTGILGHAGDRAVSTLGTLNYRFQERFWHGLNPLLPLKAVFLVNSIS
jgi:hypothetical protein